MSVFHLVVVTGIFGGLLVGASVGGQYVPQHNVVAGIAAGLIGAAAGLGLALLHRRIVLWLLGPDLPETESRLTGILAKVCVPIYGLSMIFGSQFSFLFLFLAVAFLFKPWPDKPDRLSRDECLALSSGIALCCYLQMAIVHRCFVWVESRNRA